MQNCCHRILVQSYCKLILAQAPGLLLRGGESYTACKCEFNPSLESSFVARFDGQILSSLQLECSLDARQQV